MFNCLPSEVLQEDYLWIERVKIVLDARAKKDELEEKRRSKQQKR